MMTLARVVAEYPHAVQRELLCEHYQFAGFGRPEDVAFRMNEFISFVLGAPPQSALGLAVTEGWSKTDHLIANLTEQHAGLLQLGDRYDRPGVKEWREREDTKQKETPPNASPVEENKTPLSAEQVKAAVAAGGRFDRFETPADFEAQLAKFRAKMKKAREGVKE